MDNQLTVATDRQLTVWQQNNPACVDRGIDEPTMNALMTSVFPGANYDSVLMACDYCRARELDVLQKPVHIVPMYIKEAGSNQGGMRDVIMPGIGLYRIQAARSGDMAGTDAPVFGPMITDTLDGVQVTYPEWCEITVHKLIADRVVSFTAREYWIENYANKSRNSVAPNAMWQKRSRGQLVKCTEAQALRKAWPEIGQDTTYEEMQGKEYQPVERDITPKVQTKSETLNELLNQQQEPEPEPQTTPEQATEDQDNYTANKFTEEMELSESQQELEKVFEQAWKYFKGKDNWKQTMRAVYEENKTRLMQG